MNFAPPRALGALLSLAACTTAFCQTPPTDDLTYKVETRLVLVDVVTEYPDKNAHAKTLLTDLKREDFRVFDNGKETSINSFDVGAVGGTRPLALWLIVQCNLGFLPEWVSSFLRGKTQFLRPALTHLDPTDVVGVAHWCDDGGAYIDLPPGRNPDAALATVERILHEKDVAGTNRTGEIAMQKMIRLILENVHGATPDRLPVLLFFYNDHAGTYAKEADSIIQDVLETSGTVFGMSDNGFPFDPKRVLNNGQIFYLVHYYTQETGGQFYSTSDPKLFPAALDYILSQLHLRYTLGFKPTMIDGKRHTIRVELTKQAQKQFAGAELRFRQAYIPAAKAPTRSP